VADPKPLSFDKVPSAQSTAPAKVPKPLSFPPSPPKAVAPQAAPAPAVKPLSFANAPPAPARAPAPPSPRPVMQTINAPEIHGDALKALKATNPDLVRQEELRVIRQLQQLMPLRLDVVMDWGSKTMERMRDDSKQAAAMIKLFVQANGNELIESAVNAATGVQKAGLWERLTTKAVNPIDLEPQLAALQSQLGPWMKQCDERLVSAKQHNYDTVIKLATLAAVADTVGTIADNTLDMAVNNRRTILQQGVLQSELIVRQLEDVRGQIIDQRMRIDQVINVTLPAYKAARAHQV
jgi:hypothetical protein